MARLLALADPAIIASRPSHALGHVIVVVGDEHRFTDLERRSCVELHVPDLSVEEAEIYLEPGVPPELRAARAAAWDAMAAAQTAQKPDKAAIAAAEAAFKAAHEATLGWPWRARSIDLAAVAPEHVAGAAACRACLDGCAEEAKSVAKSAVLAELAYQKGRDLTPEEIALPTRDIIAGLDAGERMAREYRDLGAAAVLEDRKVAIIAASRDARHEVESVALEAVAVPEAKVLTAKDLVSATVATAVEKAEAAPAIAVRG